MEKSKTMIIASASSTEEKEGVPKKRGRKRKAEAILRKSRITVMYTEAERKQIEEKSKHAGYKLSIYVRQVSLGSQVRAKFSPEQWAEVKRLIRLENNINQLAKRLHLAGGNLDEIEKIKADIKALLDG